MPVAPNNVGPKTIPNYDAVAAQAIRTLPGGGKVFVGQADDPFFVDLGATFDGDQHPTSRAGPTPATRAAKDDLAGYNVHSIVLQVPEAEVTTRRQAGRGRRRRPTPSSACGRRRAPR